jgi:beta-lactamase class A
LQKRSKKLLSVKMAFPRRCFVLAASALLVAGAEEPVAALEKRYGGRLGVFALDVGSGRVLEHRADERFLMCSTFKALLAALVLEHAEKRQIDLAARVSIATADLLNYAPFSQTHVGPNGASVEDLCKAAVELSDNTAANLLLARVGGPAGVTAFARGLNDTITRLDRNEPSLNFADGVKDTTTPRAIVATWRKMLLGGALNAASTAKLLGWLVDSQRGLKRLRAGVPATWQVGDKTGSGATQCNDIAIMMRPGGAPIIVSALYDAPGVTDDDGEIVLKTVGALVARWAST